MFDVFEKYASAFTQQRLSEFNRDRNGILWLKLRAISRKRQLAQFAEQRGIYLKSRTIRQQSIELFSHLCTEFTEANKALDLFLRNEENELYAGLNSGISKSKKFCSVVEVEKSF